MTYRTADFFSLASANRASQPEARTVCGMGEVVGSWLTAPFTYMRRMALMTFKELFDKFVPIVETRISRMPATSSATQFANAELLKLKTLGNSGEHELALKQFAQKLLTVTLPPPPGSCLYEVSGIQFCLTNVTPDECQALGGIEVQSCAGIPPW
jgi:hypothetical protein